MFQDQIREYYETLTPGFRKLADFIMTHTLDAAFLTVTEISRRVGVDPATVVRFAQEIGYSGYRELSREIKRYVRDQVTATYRKSTEAETEETQIHALIVATRQNLRSFTATEIPNLAETLRVLKEAKCIWVAAEALWYPVARFLARILEISGFTATAFHPALAESTTALRKMQEGDALLDIVISNPSIDTGYVTRLAREKGVRTIAITTTGVVLPAREAEIIVAIPSVEPATAPSYATPLVIIGLIWEALNRHAPEHAAERFTEYNEIMGEILSLRSETAAYEGIPPHLRE